MRQQVLRMEQELLNAESGGAPSGETNPPAAASTPTTAPASTTAAAAMGTPATTSGANPATLSTATEGAVHMDTSEGAEHGGGDEDPDGRSIYVGNVRILSCIPQPFPFLLPVCAQNVDAKFGTEQVDYGATPEEIQAHFSACGTINRVTILLDKFTGHPKGCAPFSFCVSSTVSGSWR